MKKKLVSAMLVSAMLATVLAGCGGAGSSDTQKGDSAKGGTDGSVYLLNFKPETDEAGRIWHRLTLIRQA